MDIYERILVAALASVLAIFLLVGILVLIRIVQILKTLKRITEKAESLADTASAVGELFERASGPLSIIKLFGSVIEAAVKHKKQTNKGAGDHE